MFMRVDKGYSLQYIVTIFQKTWASPWIEQIKEDNEDILSILV